MLYAIFLSNSGFVHAKALMQLRSALLAMWRLGFFFHDMAFGLLTVFIPLYLVFHFSASSLHLLGGPLLALGVMTSIAIFCSIPASFLVGVPLRRYPTLQNLHSAFLRLHCYDSFPHDASVRPEPDRLRRVVRGYADASCGA